MHDPPSMPRWAVIGTAPQAVGPRRGRMVVRQVILGVEFLLLFAGLPLALALFAPGRPVLPELWIATAGIGAS